MNENEYLAKTIKEQLEAGSPLVLVSVMSLQGSTPRHSGAKMVVSFDGKGYGTIGGSLLEDAAIRNSRSVLSTGKSKIMSFELTGKNATAPGMICGGKAELLLDYILPSEENRELAGIWHEAILCGKDFYIVTHLKDAGEKFRILSHAIIYSDGSIACNTSLIPSDIETLKSELHNISTTSIIPLENTRVMVDRIRRMKTMYCFGAGHVALPTAHLASLVGFRVVVIDDRPEFASAERFPEADEIFIRDFNSVFNELEIDKDAYIVIVTRGHQYDRVVLEQSLKTRAGYIGMISSRRKREAIYEALMAQGVKKERLEQVHSPIGINIGGETPEEIAVSIVGELISERSRQAA